MSIISRIQSSIKQLNGGEFQRFADAYVARRLVFKSMHSLGMQAGTEKTTKGVPDTYFIDNSDKYIFLMSTTDSNVFSKLKKDLNDALDIGKTKIDNLLIKEVILAHTSSNLTVEQTNELMNIAREKKIDLNIYGIDQISQDLYYRYKDLARDFLGIKLDTNQVFQVQDFIKYNDSNSIAAPLDTKFLKRDNIFNELYNKVNRSNYVIVYGKAGSGKTRISLEFCRIFSKENNYKLICIKSNDLDIYEDIITNLQEPGAYLIFIDDINMLTKVGFVLDYLYKNDTGYNVKIIGTVREYSLTQLINRTASIATPETLKVDLMSDDEIGLLIKENFDIHNLVYIKQIQRISNGNPRLAMLTAKLAVDSQDLSKLHSVSNLYDAYYGKYIDNCNSLTKEDLLVASLISIIGNFDLNYYEVFESLLESMKIDETQFYLSVKNLEANEMVDIYEDQIVKIADQNMGNYLIKYSLVDKKLIEYSDLIVLTYRKFNRQLVESMNVLSNIFYSDEIFEFVKSSTVKAYKLNVSRESSELKWSFLTSFYVFFPDEIISLIHDAIEKVKDDGCEFSLNNVSINQYYEILFGLYSSNNDLTPLELAINLLEIYPETHKSFYNELVNRCGVNSDSDYYGNLSLVKLTEHLISHSDNYQIKPLRHIFCKLAQYLLKFEFNPTEHERSKIIYYTIFAKDRDDFIQLRKLGWKLIVSLVSDNEFRMDARKILYKYHINQEYAKSNLGKIDLENICLVIKLLSYEDINDCIIAVGLGEFFKDHVQIKSSLAPFFNNREYIVFHTVVGYKYSRTYDYVDINEKIDSDIKIMLQNEDIKFILNFIENASEIFNDSQHIQSLISGLNKMIEICYQDEVTLKIILDYIFRSNQLIDKVNPYIVLKGLYTLYNNKTKAKNEIERITNTSSHKYLFAYFEMLSSDEFDKEDLESLITLMNERYWYDSEFNFHIDFRFLLKHHDNFPSIVDDIFKVILNKSLEFNVNNILVRSVFNEYLMPREVINLVTGDTLTLLFDTYCYKVKSDPNTDSNGKLLMYFYNIDSKYLYRYIDLYASLDKHTFYSRIYFIWSTPEYSKLVSKIFDIVISSRSVHDMTGYYLSDFFVKQSRVNTVNDMQRKKIELIENYLKDNVNVLEKLELIFSIVSYYPTDVKLKFFTILAENNIEFSIFDRLDLEKRLSSWTGSAIPYLEDKIKFIKGLQDVFRGLKFIKHREKLNRFLVSYENDIKKTRIEELTRSF